MRSTTYKILIVIWLAVLITQIINLFLVFKARQAGIQNPIVNCSIREDYKRSQSPSWLYDKQTVTVDDYVTQTCYKVYNQK